MLVLGLLLVLGAALITVGALYDAGETATVEILGQTLTTTAAGVFIAGLVTMLMFLVGAWAIAASFGRAKRKRADRKAAKRDHKDSVQRLEDERAALREENERLSRELTDRQRVGAAAPAAGGAAAGGAVASGSRGRDSNLETSAVRDRDSGHDTDLRSPDTDSRSQDTDSRSQDTDLRSNDSDSRGYDSARSDETVRHDATGAESTERYSSADDRVIDHRTDRTSDSSDDTLRR